jgi:hypothetical protein
MSRLSRFVPVALRNWWRRGAGANMGDLRNPGPPSRIFGLERGQPIDRWYIERFLSANATLVKGAVLEVADAEYTRRFGGARVTASDVLHATADNANATIVGDLATGEGIASGRYDAIILTQVLQFIYDIHGAVRTTHRALRQGGAVLATFTVLSPISRYDADRWGEYWRPTEQAVRRLFGDVFGLAQVRVTVHGNHVAAHAAIAGMASEELSEKELSANDADYPVVITVVATRV